MKRRSTSSITTMGPTKSTPKVRNPNTGGWHSTHFRLGDDGLVHGEKRTLIDFGDQAGGDGMTVDDKGNLYIADRSAKRPGVRITDPNGKEIGFVPTGEPNQKMDAEHPGKGFPSNVEFGVGAVKNMLYVTVDLSLYRVRLNAHGYHPQPEKQ